MRKKIFTILLALAASVGMMNAKVTWKSCNISDLDVHSTHPYSKEGVSLSANGDMIDAWWQGYGDESHNGISFETNETGGYIFSNTLGKNFTKIEMTLNGPAGWDYANLGSGWSFSDEFVDEQPVSVVTWKDNASSTVYLLEDESHFHGENVKRIEFYFEGDSEEPDPTYTVALQDGTANADKVTLSATSAEECTTVTVTPNEECEITAFSATYAVVEDQLGSIYTIDATLDPETGAYSFTMPAADVTIEATIALKPVPEGDIFAGFTATAGSGGFNNEGHANLVDNKFTSADWTKWCADNSYKSVPTGESGDACWWIDFEASEALNPTGYILTTGNDTGNEHGRNPKNWVLKAKLNADDAWTTIATVTNDVTMKNQSFKDYKFFVDQSGTYQYFRFEVFANQGANVMQLCELRLIGTEPVLVTTHTLQLHVNDALMGSVALQNPSNDIIDNGDGTYSVPEGATVTLLATPNEGYEFTGWKASSSICDFNECEFLALSTVDNPLTVDMYQEAAFMAEFAAVAPADNSVKLYHNFYGDWMETEVFGIYDDYTSEYAKISMILEPGDYQFALKVGGELRGDGTAFSRNKQACILAEGFTANLTLNVDVKGTYRFYWFYDENRFAMDVPNVCGMYWKDVTAGNFEVTLGQEGEVTLPKVWATNMGFVANIANGADQVRLGSTDETVATIAYTLSTDGLGTLTFHQAGECDIYVVHDITDYYCYDSCAFHLTVLPAPTSAVVIGDPNNASEVETFLTNYDGQTIDELIIDRPVLNNMYNTLCLPFDMNAAQIAASSLNGVEIREFTGASVEGTTLNLSVGDPVNAVVAGRPYFVKYSAASQLDDLHFEDVTINNALLDNMAVTFDGVTFKGTFTPFEMPNGLNFQGGYLFLGQNNQLFWPNTDNPLKPFRAYFYVDVESSTPGNAPKYRGMPARIVEGKNVATGVENAQSANQSTKVIVNGQLIIIKNDVRYNAQGQVVK